MRVDNIQPVTIRHQNNQTNSKPSFKATVSKELITLVNHNIRNEIYYAKNMQKVSYIKDLATRFEKYVKDVEQEHNVACLDMIYEMGASDKIGLLFKADSALNRMLYDVPYQYDMLEEVSKLMRDYPAKKIKAIENEGYEVIEAKKLFKKSNPFVYNQSKKDVVTMDDLKIDKKSDKKNGFLKRLFGKK